MLWGGHSTFRCCVPWAGVAQSLPSQKRSFTNTDSFVSHSLYGSVFTQGQDQLGKGCSALRNEVMAFLFFLSLRLNLKPVCVQNPEPWHESLQA